MKITKNASNFALISYISRCYHDSDWDTLDTLCLEREQARRISHLSVFESSILSNVVDRFAVLRLHYSRFKRCYSLVLEDPVSLSGCHSQTRETDLCLHVLNHVTALYRGNHRRELNDIGLRPEQAESISALPWVNLHKLARYFWFFMTLEVDAKLLKQAIDTSIASGRWINQCVELIRADAPRDLMLRYYGMSCQLYAEAREMHGRRCRGRPRTLPDDLQSRLYEEFVRQYQNYEEGIDPLCQPGFFLGIYENLERKVSLREIWILVQEWLKNKLVRRRLLGGALEHQEPGQAKSARTPRMAPRLRKRSKTCLPPSTTPAESSQPSSAATLPSCDRAEISG